MFGEPGLYLMALAIMISTFGCNNGMILAGARVYYAMAEDGLFFRGAAKLHPRFRTPARALWFQALWASVLCLSGTYSQLLDYVIIAALLFYLLERHRAFPPAPAPSQAERPNLSPGYPGSRPRTSCSRPSWS